MVIKEKSLFKDIIRSIYKSKARFLSILAIIALGVGFYAGINATEPDMLLSADKYYKDTNLSDFRIISPLGFRVEDIYNIKELKGVDKVQEGYSKDLFLTSREGNTSTIKLFSYDNKDYRDNDGLNTPVIIEGRMPEKSGEIVVEKGINVPRELELGREVILSVPKEEISDFLKTDTFIIVGIIQSPLYINFERGQTNIGDGAIGLYAYTTEDDFSMEKVTDLFVRTKESKNLTAYTQEYINHIKPIEDYLEILGIRAIEKETQKLRVELNDGKKELQTKKKKAEKELADGKKKLEDAKKKIIDGERVLENSKIKFTNELEDSRRLLEKGKQKLEKGKIAYYENYEKWLEGYTQYNNGMGEINNAKAHLDEAKIQIEQAESLKIQVENLQNDIQELEKMIRNLSNVAPSTQEELNKIIDSIDFLPQEMRNNIKDNYQHNEGNEILLISFLENTLNSMEEEYTIAKQIYVNVIKDIDEIIEKYEAGLVEYEKGLRELNSAKSELDMGKIELDKAKGTIDENERKISEGEVALSQGEEELKESLEIGYRELQNAKIELSKGRARFERERTDALLKIKEGEKDIKEAEIKILDIPDGWFVLNRNGNPGYSGYGDDAQRIGAVAKVFPLFFFLVAALVCLTTMTRMIEEERIQIGTLKALGYRTLTIALKYLIYALLASLTGAILGLNIGFKLFPSAIMNAYGMMYNIPESITPFHLSYAIISILLAVITTVATSLLATLQELRSTPAVLMQPKAPKPGKRIFLERITPLWKRLSFSHKVTARNIFRYKRRFLMTVIGIAGCTALLLTGFGLRDSINDIIGKQFEEIFIYDGQVFLDTEKREGDRDLEIILGEQKEVTSYIKTLNQTVNALVTGSGRTYEVNLMVPEDNSFEEFFNLQERKSKNKINLTSKGAVITEKLSNLLNLGPGDTFKYRDSENITYEIKVDEIAENYLGHYIYMSPEYYDKTTLKSPAYNSGIFNFESKDTIDEKVFREELTDHKGVLGTMLTKGIANEFGDTMASLDYVVLILIFSAGALAFVVLYNLTNINITERLREIATIKVLGFRDKEVSAYVYRENTILTIIGTLAGLVLGFAFHKFVMDTMEIDAMMFGKNIHLISYIFSIILTLVFSILVNFSMYYKLRNINMVESLKSVE